jgi:asparagine synthetase B (glutamine-hydrolysing)
MLTTLIGARGPDFQSLNIDGKQFAPSASMQELPVADFVDGWTEIAYSSVLHLRGEMTQKQPFVDAHGNTLMFNGELFDVNADVETEYFNTQTLKQFDLITKNDGVQLFKALTESSFMLAKKGNKPAYLEEVKLVLSTVFKESDMAFVYTDRLNGLTIVHRDFYGKRSLIVQAEMTADGICMMFSSCEIRAAT